MHCLFLRLRGPALAIALGLAAALVLPADALAGVGVGDRAVELSSAKDQRGKRVKLKSYRGKIVVITFGASWCKPCKKELPAWDKLAGKYKNKGVVFVAVNIDKDLSKGKAFMKKAKLKHMRAVYDPSGAAADSYEPPTMPSTYVIDGRGLVRSVHRGYRSGDAKKLARELDTLLSK
ncbi:MAG: TlpA disulfide reductase family protein [Myxococcota bacterium]